MNLSDAEHEHLIYVDHMEKLTTKIGRIVANQKELLQLAAHAAENGRLEVVQEYVDRATDMSAEIALIVKERNNR